MQDPKLVVEGRPYRERYPILDVAINSQLVRRDTVQWLQTIRIPLQVKGDGPIQVKYHMSGVSEDELGRNRIILHGMQIVPIKE